MTSPESSTDKKRDHPLLDIAIGLGVVALGFTLVQHALLEGALYFRHHR